MSGDLEQFCFASVTEELTLSSGDLAGNQKEEHDLLKVDYLTLHMDKTTHAISRVLKNDSPLDAYNITVYAIAMSEHSKVLDVAQSSSILKVPANGSAPFTLIPIDSTSQDVGYYNCFVSGQLGQNYTFPAEDNKTITFELGSDGEIKNVQYNKAEHAISFSVEGMFSQKGWAEIMVLSPSDSFSNSSSLGVTLMGRRTQKAFLTSDLEDENS